MTLRRLSPSALVIALALPAPCAWAAQNGGGVMGWVEDSGGAPVAGALISLFGRGTGGAGVVTLSDSSGRFFLPSLPAGSYTLRAMGRNRLAAPARQITVLPNRDFSFTVSLSEDAADAQAEGGEEASSSTSSATSTSSAARRERDWLLRHKRRSVLEARGQESEFEQTWNVPAPSGLLASWIPDLGGTVEVMTTPPGPWGETVSGDIPSTSVLRLKGRIAGSGRWALGGLVSESESTAWRMAAEFVTEPVEGHELQVGTGYGTRFVRPVLPTEGDRLHDRSVGALFAQDRWDIADSVSASVGTRFSYIGFLDDAHHIDPSGSIEFRRDDHTRLVASFATRTMAPGGDLLTLSTLATGPAFTYAEMDQGLRAERSVRVELAVAQEFGATTLRAHTFYEGVRDQLANAFDETAAGEAPTLHILNAGGLEARGMGVSLGHRFGRYVNGQVSYTYGHAWRSAPVEGTVLDAEVMPILAFQSGDFHDVVARLETVIEDTDTRVIAFYRLNHLSGVEQPALARRFDVQLSQGLPFLGALTRADWDVLVAVRNLYYDVGEGAILDEQAVSNPPKRVLGGIAVRF